MLTQATAVTYLLKRDLVSPQAIVDGDLVVADFTRRNANFRVASEVGPGYLLKQGIDQERRAMLAHEAEVYGLLGSRAGAKRLRRYMPQLHLYHADESILVLELLRD